MNIKNFIFLILRESIDRLLLPEMNNDQNYTAGSQKNDLQLLGGSQCQEQAPSMATSAASTSTSAAAKTTQLRESE